jgi:non-ribosomal peptide synthase protein (TIGR01720 family)
MPASAPNPEDPAYILFTSGSTGLPKPVVVPHRAVAWYLDGLLARTGLPRGLSYGFVSTFSADLGLTATLPALFHGGTLCIQSEAAARDPLLLAEAQRRWPVDLLKIVPSHLEALLAGTPDPALLPRHLLVLGGERALPALLGRLAELASADLRVMNHYGPTETTVGVAMGEWRRGDDQLRLDAPLAGGRIAVLDERGEPVPSGGTGEIHIGGPQLALGYAGQAEETARRFRPQPQSGIAGPLYATGDLARLDADGTLKLLGRRDDQVKIRGYRVEPGEVAAALQSLPQVATAAVVAVEHPARGPVLVAHVVPTAGGADPAALGDRLRGLLPAHMQPARILLLPALPLTANGKLDRAALPVPDWDDTSPASTDIAPASGGAEATLLAVWRELFNRPDIGPHDDFFALGGDSILGIRMVGRLHQEGFHLLATDLYRHPSAATLAPLVRVIRVAGTEAEQGMLTGPVPLLPSQHRWLALGGGLHPHTNLSLLLELAPEVTPGRVTEAFARLMAQHDGLRLRARQGDAVVDSVVQEFGPIEAPKLHLVSAGPDTAAQLDRLQSVADPAGAGLVLGWLEGTPARLLIVLHHWLVDAVSCAILLEDLARLLRDLAADLGPKTLSLRQWAEALTARAAGTAVLDQAEFWTLCTELPPPSLPLRRDGGAPGLQGAEASAAFTLSERETRDLLNGPAILAGLEVEDILLAGLTLALGELTGEPLLFVELEGHGRTPPAGVPDPSRTVGWFTARYPAWFDLTGVEEAQAAAAVRDQRLSLPNRGLDYGLLRWLGPEAVRERLARGYAPVVSLNYLGQIPGVPDAPFRLASWRPGCPLRGTERTADLPRPHLIAVEAMLLDGQLRLDVLYDSTLLDPGAMARLAEALGATAVRLARLTPLAAPPTAGLPALDADDLTALAASL